MITEAIILCGGKGTRFKNISRAPKILADFGNEKFLDLQIEYLRENNFERIILAVGYELTKLEVI